MSKNNEQSPVQIHIVDGMPHTFDPITNELVELGNDRQAIPAVPAKEYTPSLEGVTKTNEKAPLTLRTKLTLGATALSVLLAYPGIHATSEWVANSVVNNIPFKSDVHLDAATYFSDIGVSIQKLIPGGSR